MFKVLKDLNPSTVKIEGKIVQSFTCKLNKPTKSITVLLVFMDLNGLSGRYGGHIE